MKLGLLIKLLRTVQFAFVGVIDRHIVQDGPGFLVLSHAFKQIQRPLICGNGLFKVSARPNSIGHQAYSISRSKAISSSYKYVVSVFTNWRRVLRLFTIEQVHALLLS